jgi:hypothetical protein
VLEEMALVEWTWKEVDDVVKVELPEDVAERVVVLVVPRVLPETELVVLEE